VYERVDFFQELTPLAASAILRVVVSAENCKGTRFLLKRGAGDRTRLTVEVVRFAEKLEGLPAPKDVWPLLCSLWGLIGKADNPFSTDLPKPEDFA
jgi:hypothetical protein